MPTFRSAPVAIRVILAALVIGCSAGFAFHLRAEDAAWR
jgi:hypothetical protein